jgi:hypothetical protein
MPPAVLAALDELKRRRNPDGGFAIVSGEKSRPDATAWALLALRSCGMAEDVLDTAGSYLKSFQHKDGRVVLAHDEAAVIWVSYVAAWAWQGLPSLKAAQEQALAFILSVSGRWSRFNAWGMAHNQSLKGWCWVDGTSSWVDSTVLALLALRAAGLEKHSRYVEGIELLKDRELPSGGWNCGNTIVYGTELRPTSESTGMAMALLDCRDSIHASSVKQLRHFIRKETGPLTLGWALLAIGTEKDLPVLDQALMIQQKKHFCQTEWLGLLCMAWAVLSSEKAADILGFPKGNRV